MFKAAAELTAAEVTGRDVAGPVVVILLLAGSAVFVVGYAMAVMHRANKDYKTTKAALPNLRKGFWRSWWTAVKRGAVVLLIFICLVIYWWRSGGSDADATTPHPSKSPRPVMTDRWVTRTPAITHR
ncbi:hypothetical protein [Actinoplanes sp. NPDC026619]|uniref:hypothetical protein n=1 Tax=Actinoplanes sp. NPDC026619 TaxID=3155798 RepID=UPI0033BFC479